MLAWEPASRSLLRVFSSDQDLNPVGVRKTTEVSAHWLDTCITRQQPYLGVDAAAMRAVLGDAAQLVAAGCGAIINVPVAEDGQVVGVLNILGPEHAFTAATLDAVLDTVGPVRPAIAAAIRASADAVGARA